MRLLCWLRWSATTSQGSRLSALVALCWLRTSPFYAGFAVPSTPPRQRTRWHTRVTGQPLDRLRPLIELGLPRLVPTSEAVGRCPATYCLACAWLLPRSS